MKTYTLKCFLCGKEHDEKDSVTSCLECKGPLETYYDYKEIQRKLNLFSLKSTPISAMKYINFYPINDYKKIVTLEEGGTPLIHAKYYGRKIGLKNLYFKDEGINPTGCFKDRGTLVEVTKAKELGAEAICLASTGNMAASVAAYSSAAGKPCYVLVPEGTPIGKLSQTLSFGARVIQVRSDYSTCAVLAEKMANRFGYYLAGDYTFRTEGQKSQGYEIVDQLFWKSPDYIVCPIGCGTNLHAIYKGIKEFHEFGFVDKIPKLIGVQTPGCNPIFRAFKSYRKDFDIIKNPYTVAGAMCVGDPLDGEKILSDIYESKGICTEVTDDEILKAQQEQAKMIGIFGEPSGSMAFAAIKKLNEEKFFNEEDVIVAIVNGNGLKDPKSPLRILSEPASLEPDFEEIERFIDRKLYAVRESGSIDKWKILFDKDPKDSQKVYNIIIKEFGIEPSKEITEMALKEIQNFLNKGKNILKSDLKYILEDVLNEIDLTEKVLKVNDFKVKTGLNEKAEAEIYINAFGKDMKLKGYGVGTVDAAISAIKKGIKDKDHLKVELVDYEVSINSETADSTVDVKMALKDKNGNKVYAKTTSPDVIVASIRAYEKGFNILYAKNDKKLNKN